MFTGTSFCSHSVKGLYEKATGRDSSLKSDPLWEGRLNATSHRLQEHRSGVWGPVRGAPGARRSRRAGTGPLPCVRCLRLSWAQTQ